MKKSILLALLIFLLPIVVLGQKISKKNRQINVSTYINYNPESNNIAWEERRTGLFHDLDLEFLTPSSGLFEIEFDTLNTNQITTLQLPQNKMSLGFGYQVLNSKNVYHEFQIPIFNVSSSSEITERYFENAANGLKLADYEWQTTVSLIQIGLRYEIGKYLGKAEKGKIKLGFGFNAGTLYSQYNNEQNSFRNNTRIDAFEINGNLIDINFGINSNLWFKASDKISIELKFTPQLNFTINNLNNNNPRIQKQERGGTVVGDKSDLSYYVSFSTKFKIQDFTKSRRRRKK